MYTHIYSSYSILFKPAMMTYMLIKASSAPTLAIMLYSISVATDSRINRAHIWATLGPVYTWFHSQKLAHLQCDCQILLLHLGQFWHTDSKSSRYILEDDRRNYTKWVTESKWTRLRPKTSSNFKDTFRPRDLITQTTYSK